MQYNAFVGAVEAIDGAHRHARRIGAVHTGDRDGFFTGHAIVQRDHAATVHTPRHFVFVFTGCNAAIALDTALSVTDEFHSCHDVFLIS